MKSKKKALRCFLMVVFWVVLLEGVIDFFISLKGPFEKSLGNPALKSLKTKLKACLLKKLTVNF